MQFKILLFSFLILGSFIGISPKKSALCGLGKPSKVNKLPKLKITSGHRKRTSKGYTYVNPYARSK
jgi:hypothetical protein